MTSRSVLLPANHDDDDGVDDDNNNSNDNNAANPRVGFMRSSARSSFMT